MLVGRSATLSIPSSILIGLRRHELYLPDEDGIRNAFAEIFLADGYGLHRRRRGSFRTVLDIGANIGLFAVAARKYHRHTAIHAYEPNVALEPFLAVQLRVAGATWFPEAVGGGAAQGRLETYRGASVLSRCVPDESGTVPIVPLATAVERMGKVDFAKIDCEGSEWAMLDEPEPWQSIAELALEYHILDGHTEVEAVDRLDALGFAVLSVSRGPDCGVILATRRGRLSGRDRSPTPAALRVGDDL
jgi:FkbM family methyltransferase